MTFHAIAFPAARRRSEIEQAARMLNETHGAAAVAAWKELMRSMAARMQAMGVAENEVREQILDFQAAVQIELQYIAEAV
ncbi:hypothetical protein IHQ71_20305 [Rhizobium sp. TH2]|uniref:DUF6074 family protein n=1 Tax=Rhizobium sp. TH2 TaxID=2775403 RepID=UPI0021581765|nr:DUF6074 family protein [Rhizobium sp. TH2]UVC07524.1 hypothetical protein IHQ71_20305 [Rhizobium sp. TH2]